MERERPKIYNEQSNTYKKVELIILISIQNIAQNTLSSLQFLKKKYPHPIFFLCLSLSQGRQGSIYSTPWDGGVIDFCAIDKCCILKGNDGNLLSYNLLQGMLKIFCQEPIMKTKA